jgi:hypothetical protein
MDALTNETSLAELVAEIGALMTGLGVLSVVLIPLAVPGPALLAAVLALPLVVLARSGCWMKGVITLLRHLRPKPGDAGEELGPDSARHSRRSVTKPAALRY